MTLNKANIGPKCFEEEDFSLPSQKNIISPMISAINIHDVTPPTKFSKKYIKIISIKMKKIQKANGMFYYLSADGFSI